MSSKSTNKYLETKGSLLFNIDFHNLIHELLGTTWPIGKAGLTLFVQLIL